MKKSFWLVALIALAVPSRAQIVAGDKLYVIIADQDQTFTVSQSGAIFVKGLGEVLAAGLSPSELRDSMQTALSVRGLTDIAVSVNVIEEKPEVTLLGAVSRPGLFKAESLLELLALAGGPDPEASEITVRDAAGETSIVSVRSLLDGIAPNIELTDGAVVIVRTNPTTTDSALAINSNVLITGFGVKTTVLPPGDLREALIAAGYAPGQSNITMRVYRKEKTIMLDLDRIIHGRVRFETQAGDSVYIEPKTDPISFILRILGFGRTVAGTVGQFGQN